jgi:hypothetical protein
MFHSRGCVYGRNGLIDSPQKLRDRAEVAAFAPGGYIDPSLCKSVTHYVSTRDFIPWIDLAGRQRCKDTIITLKPHPRAPMLDHGFRSPTLEPEMKKKLKTYMER